MSKISGNMVLFRLMDAICQKVGRILIVLESAVVPLQFRAQKLQQFIVTTCGLRLCRQDECQQEAKQADERMSFHK